MYEGVTYEVILKRMLDRVSNTLDKREGAVIWDTHSPTAIELQILYLELDNILKESFADTASRDYLILRAKERGVDPYPASSAVRRAVFTPGTINVLGQRFSINELNYIVTKRVSGTEYQVTCEQPGVIGNQYSGILLPIQYIPGLQTAELLDVLIPGEDEEATEDLRKRYFNTFNGRAFGGNRQDYLEKCNAIPGVGATKVKRVWNDDISPQDMIPNDAVNRWYGSTVGSVDVDTAAWLTAVYTAALDQKLTTGGTVLLTIIDSDFNPPSTQLLQSVKDTFDPAPTAEGYGLAPIGHAVVVRGGVPVIVEVQTTITFQPGYGWDNLQDSINQVVSDYFLELRKTWADADTIIVRISQVEARILTVAGIVDITNTIINGVADNLTLTDHGLPMFGGVVSG